MKLGAAVLPLTSAFLPLAPQSHRCMSLLGMKARDLKLFRETPLLPSNELTAEIGKPVYFKFDCLQESGSFKDRGMAHLCQTLSDGGITKLVSSSGGNAGLAVATMGRRLGMSVDVIVPETTKTIVIAKLESLGATVTVHGENWNAADTVARQRVTDEPAAAYVSPYDDPLLWTGHSTIVDEIVEQLVEPPGCIVVSVGGGGLLCGILEGLERHGLTTTVVASETQGASSFGQAWARGELVRLDSIDSIATSLGALEVTKATLEKGMAFQERGGKLIAVQCDDKQAVNACDRFCKEYRTLVEPACGAGLAVAYDEELCEMLKEMDGPIVLEVCGGSGVNMELLASWKEQHGL